MTSGTRGRVGSCRCTVVRIVTPPKQKRAMVRLVRCPKRKRSRADSGHSPDLTLCHNPCDSQKEVEQMRIAALMTLLAGSLLACGGGGEVTFQVSSAGGSYDADLIGTDQNGSNTTVWVNTSTQGDLSMSLGTGTTGRVRVTVKDNGGTVVFEGTISSAGSTSLSGTTTSGTPGNWEVRIEATNLDGSASVSLSPV